MLCHVLAYSGSLFSVSFLRESGSEDLISKAVSKELASGITLEHTRKCKVHRLGNLHNKT